MTRVVNYHLLPPAIAGRALRVATQTGLDLPPEARWVLGLSDFAAKVAESQRDWFAAALAAETFAGPPDATSLETELAAVAESQDMDSLKRTLRLVRNRRQFWIVWRHLLGLGSLEETVGALSCMADKLIDAALAVVERWQRERHGEPVGAASQEPQRLFVLALGKLGGQELNLSSDIDLTFGYPEPGQTADGLSNQRFFMGVGQRLIEALHKVTEDGFAFRVDMRLRPYGDSGALVMHSGAMEQYYEAEGRNWERFAFIKARACAGDLAAGNAFLESIRPFIYRRYLDFGAIEAMREMKALRVHDRRYADDLKRGAGGIRDAEFAVQAQQLVRGGREPPLQEPSFLKALAEIESLGVFAPDEAAQLGQAYRFLRHSEHSVQAEGDQQGQRLPATDLSRLRLALSLGYPSYDAYLSVLAGHRANVEALFERVLQVGDTEFDLDLWALRGDPLSLARAGFGDGASASEMLLELAAAQARPAVGEESRQRLDELMPPLLHRIGLTPDAAEVLKRVAPVLRTVLRRSTYLVLLREHPEVVERLLGLVGASQWVADRIQQRPMLLNLLLEGTPVQLALDRQALVDALGERLAAGQDEEAVLEELRAFKEQHVFRVAAAETLGVLPLMHVSDYLTHLAEAILEHTLKWAWGQCAAQQGGGVGGDRRPFIVVGYGKLGGVELGPGSDLDLVFLHDLPLSQSRFVHRLAQKLLHCLTAPTYLGPLYEIDMRLRPSGNAGTMVSSLRAFEDYQRNRAWVWEHQALVRARAVAGDAELVQRFEEVRVNLLRQQRDRDDLRSAIIKMRQRMADHQGKDEDLKSGFGGIVDIEFMVQYLVLAYAHREPSLAVHSDNVRILEAAAETGLLAPGDAESLTRAYLALRAQRHRNVLDLGDRGGADTAMAAHRGAVGRVWEQLFGASRVAGA